MTESLTVPAASGTVRLMRNDIVRIALAHHSRVEHSMAVALADDVQAVQAGSSTSVLLELTGVASVSREARAVFASLPGVSRWALLGSSPVDRILASFVLGAAFRPGSGSFFTSESEALRWLTGHANVL